MIDKLFPPLMEYEDTVEYLIAQLLIMSEADQVTMVNGHGLKRTIKNPEIMTVSTGRGDFAFKLSPLDETIYIENPAMIMAPDTIKTVINVCTRALENALKFELMRKNISIDELTGLINKNTLKKRVDEEIAHCERVGGRFSIAFIDLDNFKTINDTYGHLVGDAVLTEIAALLQESFRQSNVIARFGGDEFIIMFKDATKNIENSLMNRILATMEGIKKTDLSIKASVGFSYYPDDGCSFEKLISTADKKMYVEKQRIRQCATK